MQGVLQLFLQVVKRAHITIGVVNTGCTSITLTIHITWILLTGGFPTSTHGGLKICGKYVCCALGVDTGSITAVFV